LRNIFQDACSFFTTSNVQVLGNSILGVSEKRIVETSDNDNVKSSLSNESQVSNVDNDKIAPVDLSGISTPTDNVSESDNVSELEVQKVSESEVQVQQEEETPNIELPSAWTLDVVKKEQAS
jgi:hypothetical protein